MNPGKELDALVAERVMGCDLEPNEPCGTSLSHCPYDKSEHTRFFLTGLVSSGTPKPYSTDIGAAWEVVEKLGQERIPKRVIPGEMQKYCLWLHQDIDGSFVAHFSPDESTEMSLSAGFPTGPNTTAAHAICLAALKAVGYEIEVAA